jgi:hypothetical protein
MSHCFKMIVLLGIIWTEWMIVLRPNGDYIYSTRGNPRLQYYNNALDYYTLNTPPQMQRIVLQKIPKSSQISTTTLQMGTSLWRDNNRREW